MEKSTSCNIQKIDELLEIENSLFNLSNKMMDAELKKDKQELEKIREYYSMTLYIEHKKINELKLNHDSFLEIINYLKEKNHLHNCRIESIIFEKPHFPSLRIIYRLMTIGIENTNIEDLMNSFQEQEDILNSLFDYQNDELSKDKSLYGLILAEQQLARTYLYNLEDYVADNEELMRLKHNLSYVYNYQIYNDKLAIIESNNKLEKFFRTDTLTYTKVTRSYLKRIALIILANSSMYNLDENKLESETPSTKQSLLLKSIIFILDDLAVRDLKNMAIKSNNDACLKLIEQYSIEKYEPNINFKRR